MGTAQSTHTTSEITEIPQKQESPPSSVSGRKQSNEDNVLVEPHVISTDEDTDSVGSSELGYEEESDDDSDEEEEDEEWAERVRILQDARNLKKLAGFFLCPEKPVIVDATATARCFFSRPSAPHSDETDEEEVARVLADARALKSLAVDYLQPERPVQADPMLFGRNYFSRPSAPTSEEDEDRNQIIADAKALKKLAVDYLHPENPVVTSDPCATGRNYFSRYSAEGVDEEGLASERDQILAEAESLKKLAVDYLHPEKPVVTSDPYATGRNYFTRPGAEEQEDEDMMDEREDVLQDMAELKRLAEYYMKPESPVIVDALASCRSYFDRPSAIPQEDQVEAEERAKILADANDLKRLAVDYLHPEKPVVTTDPFAMGRNFFSRPSAEEYDAEDEASERDSILADMMQLKKLALDYLHPELPVVTSDPYAMGRNYFSRSSAEEYDDSDDRQLALEDAAALKKLAVDYLHPEKPVVVDAFAMARNYFTRYTAEEQEDEDTMDEREDVLADVNELKRLAQDYLQPERPVQADPMLFGRNYFSRPSAPTSEEDEERNQIIADAKALKKLAVDYLHPENPVVTSDPCATGRNYFSRYSAEGVDEEGLASERDQILAEAESLKKLAVDYLHPEKPVVTSDPYATGRNYFTRASAEEFDEDYKERMLVLEDAAALKKLAVDYLCPERPVETDAFAKGRNYFSRYSAEEEPLDPENMEEKDRVLEDMRQLKQLAVDFMHPEVPVQTTDPSACGRNYFSRASAAGLLENIHSEGHALHQAQHEQVVTLDSVPPHGTHHDLEYSDHEYYQYHPDDHLHSDHQSQSDHFEMDEDMAQDFRYFRESLHTMVPLKGAEPPREEDEGKLSRSPSSVMLFDEAAM